MAVDRTPQQLDQLGEKAAETAKVLGETNKVQKKKNKAEIQDLGKRQTAAKKLGEKLEQAGRSSKFMTEAQDIFTARLSKDATISILKFAGGLGLAAAVTKKYVDGIVAINRALPNFNESFGEALLNTGKAVFQTGLNMETLTSVMKNNTLAFRTFRTSLTGAVQDNEALRLSLGLSREEFTNLTARAAIQSGVSADAADAQEQLAKFSRRYIINLNELALQTGRQASEVEASRVSNSRSSAGFIATLDKQGATLFQQAQRDAERAGSGFATQLSALVSSADFTENIKKINEFTIAALSTNAQTQLVGQKELQASLDKLQIGAAQRNGALVAEAFRELTPFGIALNESQEALLKFPVPVNEAQALLVTNAANIGRVLTETGQTATESGAAQLKGQRIQLGKLEDFFGTTIGKLTAQFSQLSAALGNFGGDIGAISLAFLAFKGPLLKVLGSFRFLVPLLGALTLPVTGAIALLVASAALIVSRFDKIKEGLAFIGRDLKNLFLEKIPGPIIEFFTSLPDKILSFIKNKIPFAGKATELIKGVKGFFGGDSFIAQQAREIVGDVRGLIGDEKTVKPSGVATAQAGDAIGVKTIKKIQAQTIAKSAVAAPAPTAGPPTIELGVGEAEALSRSSGASLANMNQQLANLNSQIDKTVRLQDQMNLNLRTIANNSSGLFSRSDSISAARKTG